MPTHLMIVPSLACLAACQYCFGPHKGETAMRRETVEAIVAWQNQLGNTESLEITFHGGEPLVPGIEFYAMALPLLREGLQPRRVTFAMQSNLWLLTEGLCDLFRQYGVALGTSLDGPETINDAQRGAGYFRRTMANLNLARKRGLSVGCICTFTPQSVPHASEIFDFFVHEGLSFTIHEAVPSLRYPAASDWTLSPAAHGELLKTMLDRYLANLGQIRIGTLDALCRSVSAGKGGICTFGDCLGGYLAVAPEGDIYPCQRFAGMPAYRLGNVHDCPSATTLAAASVWQAFQDRQQRITEECGDCAYIAYCRGGCPYNALTANPVMAGARREPLQAGNQDNGGRMFRSLRDPNCPAYKRIFQEITDRALAEVFSPENMNDVVNRVDEQQGLLRRGKLLAIMRDGPHPYDTAQHAKRIVAAVALAATNSPAKTAQIFQQLRLTTNVTRTEMGLRGLYQQLTAPVNGLNNLYLHVTFTCPLRCTHCYAQAGMERTGAMAVERIIRVCREAAEAGFRQAVITGGEPLAHPQRDQLLDALAEIRAAVKPMLTVLRTSLAMPVDDNLLRRLGNSTDQVVVSVDGDRETHDARRGAGNYDIVVDNLRKLVNMEHSTEISLVTVLPLHLAHGAAGEAVRALAKALGIRRTRFRPVLPLGRAREIEPDIAQETSWETLEPQEMFAYGFQPVASCGIGQNLEITPDGSAYPCYAWHGKSWHVGAIADKNGLTEILRSASFRLLGQHTVNTNRQCQQCGLRYLCGGACRAWNRQNEQTQHDLDAPPRDCTPLFNRARSLWVSALAYLDIAEEHWQAALPLPIVPKATR